jgi:hypothetical protein
MEPSFISKKYISNRHALPAKTSYENAFLSEDCFLQLPVEFYTEVDVALPSVVLKTCACWTDFVGDLRGDCSNLASISSSFFSVRHPVQCIFFFFA